MGHDLILVRKLFHSRPENTQLVLYAGGAMWAVRDVSEKSIIVSPIKNLKIDSESFEYETFTVGNYWYMPKGDVIQLGVPVLRGDLEDE